MNADTYRQIEIVQNQLVELRRLLQNEPAMSGPLNGAFDVNRAINSCAQLQAHLPVSGGLIDRNGKLIAKGSVVRYKDGWQSVRSIKKGAQTVNLTSINHSKINHYDVPLADIYEDGAAQWEAFTKTETYQSM